VIRRVLQCDGCLCLLSEDDGMPCVEIGNELEWRAKNRKWKPDYDCVPLKWFCPACKGPRDRKSLVPPAPPA
jgi:hypothetical protein